MSTRTDKVMTRSETAKKRAQSETVKKRTHTTEGCWLPVKGTNQSRCVHPDDLADTLSNLVDRSREIQNRCRAFAAAAQSEAAKAERREVRRAEFIATAAASKEEEVLPTGWTAQMNNSGKTYYHINLNTYPQD